jgi:hypothetical protein
MIWYFIKFFEREEWADQFMAGHLYLNTLGYFKKMESGGSADRGDPTEAVAMWLQPYDVTMTIKVPDLQLETTITAKDLAAPIQFSSTYHDNLHLLCLYAMHSDDAKIEDGKATGTLQEMERLQRQLRVDPKCFEMGKYAVTIHAVPFLKQLREALTRQHIAATGKLVSYYDDAVFHGEIAASEIPFSKQKRFSYQREFRVCLNAPAPTAAALIVEIGDLSAIGRKIPANQFQRFNEFEVTPHAGSCP